MFLSGSILPAAQIFDLAIYIYDIYDGDGGGSNSDNDHNLLALSLKKIDRSILYIWNLFLIENPQTWTFFCYASHCSAFFRFYYFLSLCVC